MKHYLQIITLLASGMCSSICAQEIYHIKGVVKDTIGNPIPMISISLVENNSILNYSYSSELGKFEISSDKRKNVALILSGMGFKKKSISLDSIIQNNINTYPIIIQMDSKPFVLNEVSVNGKVPVVIKKDTLSYLAEAYLNGSEKSTEDLLKKLPGIEVSEDGMIKAYGKQIEKVMIDGDDLFNKGYKILTKNLDAQFIERVEVLDHYFENQLYRNIDSSDKVAINLSLKKNINPVFGSAEIAHSHDDLFLLRNNLISLRNKTKTYFFANTNNSGIDPTADIYELLNSNSINSNSSIGDDIQSKQIVQLGSYSIPRSFNNKFNEAEFVSLNNIYNPFKNWKIKNVSFFAADEIDTFKNERIYYKTDSEFQTHEESQKRNRIKNFYTNLNIQNSNSKNRFEYNVKLVEVKENNNSKINFNQDTIEETLSGSASKQDHKIAYTHKINNLKLIESTARYIYDRKPINYQVVNHSAIPDLALNNQNGVHKTSFIGFESNYVTRKKSLIQSIRFGISNTKQLLNIKLINNSLPINDTNHLNDSQRINHSKYFAELIDKLNFKNWTFKSSLKLQKSLYDLTAKEFSLNHSPLTMNSSIGGLYKWKKRSTISGFYNYTNNTLDPYLIRSSLIQTGFRNYSYGLDQFVQLKGHQFLLSYEYGDWSKPLTINSYLIYQLNPNYTSYQLLLNPNYNVNTPIILENQQIYSFNLYANYFSEALKGNLKLEFSYSKYNFDNIINSIPYNTTNNLSKIKSQWRSTFNGIVNFHLGYNNFLNQYNNRSIINESGFLDIDIKLNSKLLLLSQNEVFNYSSGYEVYKFLNLKLIYKPREKNYNFTLSFNNIFNENQYLNQTINEYSIYTTSYKLFPRNLMVDFYFKI